MILVGLPLFFIACALTFRPDVHTPPPRYPAAQVAAAVAAQQPKLDLRHPPRITQVVNYAEGSKAAWWPKGQAPVLAALVREGRLPPVAARVGPEPIVMKGVEGLGRYGGTWERLAASDDDVAAQMNSLLSYTNLVRWSPQGYPIVPHLAKSWTISDDYRVYTFHLRRGMRWSDGAPVTADDFTYWDKWEIQALGMPAPQILRYPGTAEVGRLEKVDRYTIRFVFPKPWPLFLERLATYRTIPGRICMQYCVPSHFLRQYNPVCGNPRLIAAAMRKYNCSSPRDLYWFLKSWRDPLQPSLAPWILRAWTNSSPFVFVRNPYYPAVDPAGNQLPYLDRLVISVRPQNMFALTAAAGQVSMQDRYIDFKDHVLLTSQAAQNHYQVYYWYPGTRSSFTIFPNLNRRVTPGRPDTRWKHRLLNDRRFRQALSLAINRPQIIQALYDGKGEPAQIDPGPNSPFFSRRLFKSYTAYDPAAANARLDALGLTRRDSDGYRTFPDGSKMVWYMSMTETTDNAPAQLVIDDWARVGIHCIPLIHGRLLWELRQSTQQQDFSIYHGESEFTPLIEPRDFVPTYGDAFYASGYGLWYLFGGPSGAPIKSADAIAPPPGSAILRNMNLLDEIYRTPDPARRIALFHQIEDTDAREVWTISLVTPPPQQIVVKDGFRNVPKVAVYEGSFESPGNAGIETYYWARPHESPAVYASLKQALADPPTVASGGGTTPPAAGWRAKFGRVATILVHWSGLVLLAAIVAAGWRWPYLGRRLLIMIPTMAVISVVVFAIVQLPPGDFATIQQMQYEEQGTPDAAAAVRELRHSFHLDEPMPVQYLRWVGLLWFTSFKPADTGLLEGNLGRSMEYNRPVSVVVGDRITLTVVVSLATVLLTWTLAIPIGIYSAVRQYSLGDYGLTVLGFLGMSVPGFLLALILMFLAHRWFGQSVSGLFSPAFASIPGWSWPKVLDLLKHLWVPVVVLGLGGTAGMIRVMRANLLDELRKPYVTAARARGLPPLRLLLRYPVRLALNPFVSGIGSLFPDLISGGAIVAIVLSLPMIGPVLLDGLLSEDVPLAASMLVVMSFLAIVGTLVSDLLLMALDPRIRMQGGGR